MNCKYLLFVPGYEDKMAEESCQQGFVVVVVEGVALEEDGTPDQ